MRNAIKRLCVFTILIVLSLVFAQAHAETSIVVGSSVDSVYEEMIILFELKNYEKVISTFEDEPRLAAYKDAVQYYYYSLARQEIENGEYSAAVVRLNGLGDFKDGGLWLSYCRGRIAEEEKNYREAIEYYMSASALTETDCFERIEACTGRQERQEKEDLLNETVALYETAAENGDRDAAEACLTVFESLSEEYALAAEMAEKCRAWLVKADRKLVLTWSVSGTSAGLTWTDTFESRSYLVKVSVANSGVQETIEAGNRLSCELTGLIPGTDYEVSVCDAEDESASSEPAVISIPAAERMSRSDLQCSKTVFYGLDRAYLTTGDMSLAQLVSLYPELPKVPENNRISLSKINETIFYFSSSFAAYEDSEITISSVLRTGSNAAWKTEEETVSISAGAFSILTDLDDLFEVIKSSGAAIPRDVCTFELYVDGEICASVVFEIE